MKVKLTMKDVIACTTRIQGFTGEAKQPVGTIDLPVELGEGDRTVAITQTFVIIDSGSSYNVFLGRPTLADFKIALALLVFDDEVSYRAWNWDG